MTYTAEWLRKCGGEQLVAELERAEVELRAASERRAAIRAEIVVRCAVERATVGGPTVPVGTVVGFSPGGDTIVPLMRQHDVPCRRTPTHDGECA